MRTRFDTDIDTETLPDYGKLNEPAKRHLFGVRRRTEWIVGSHVPAGTLGTAICGALAMAYGEILGGLKEPRETCEKCVAIRDEIILRGMGLL